MSFWTPEEYFTFEYLILEDGTYGLELLSKGIPNSSLIIIKDWSYYRTEVKSSDYEWNKIGAFHLDPGRHSFTIRQFDTKGHDSNIAMKKIRIVKLS